MHGRLEMLVGPMFGSKSETLIARLRRAEFAKKNVFCFKPVIDTRYSVEEVVSHSNVKYKAIPVDSSKVIADLVVKTDHNSVVGVDEVQFFDSGIVTLIKSLINKGVYVIVSGLDVDSNNEPFSITSTLMAYADKVDKLTAICFCGNEATKTFRLSFNKERVLIGGAGMYEARCLTCFNKGA